MPEAENIAVLFPGQGSHADGMRELVAARRPDLFEQALDEVGDDLFERAGDGTRWAQPAIFCAALAGWEQLRTDTDPALMAGHSLGEIAALVAAEAMSAADGLRLVAARGALMQDAAEVTGDGGMMAVRARGDRSAIHAAAESAGVALANDNAPDQLVLSGANPALDEAETRLGELGVRAKRLPVAGAFHSPLMEPAVCPFRDLVADVEIGEPLVPVLSCVTAEPFDDVPRRLVEAITSPVRWLDVMRRLDSLGATRYVETGPGKVLSGLVRKALDGAQADAPLARETANA